ncbi:MAG: hypothetical protein AB1330_01095 [Bacillota bacterium]
MIKFYFKSISEVAARAAVILRETDRKYDSLKSEIGSLQDELKKADMTEVSSLLNKLRPLLGQLEEVVEFRKWLHDIVQGAEKVEDKDEIVELSLRQMLMLWPEGQQKEPKGKKKKR